MFARLHSGDMPEPGRVPSDTPSDTPSNASSDASSEPPGPFRDWEEALAHSAPGLSPSEAEEVMLMARFTAERFMQTAPCTCGGLSKDSVTMWFVAAISSAMLAERKHAQGLARWGE